MDKQYAVAKTILIFLGILNFILVGLSVKPYLNQAYPEFAYYYGFIFMNCGIAIYIWRLAMFDSRVDEEGSDY